MSAGAPGADRDFGQRTAWTSSPTTVEQVIHEVETSLDIINRGRIDGRDEEPASAALKHSAAEAAAIDQVQLRASGAMSDNIAQLRDIETKAAGRSALKLRAGIAETEGRVDVEASRAFANAHDELLELWRAELRASSALKLARRKAGRDAQYPDDTTRMVMNISMMVMFAIEIIANSTFWAATSASGQAGGLFQAAGFAVLTAGPAWLFGTYVMPLHFAPRAAGNKMTGKNWAGVWLTPAWLIYTVGMALVIGHLRLAAESDLPFMETFSKAPLGAIFSSTDALILTAISIIGSLFIAIEAFLVDDKIPSLGAADRTHREAVQTLNQKKAKIRKEMQAVIDSSLCTVNVLEAQRDSETQAIRQEINAALKAKDEVSATVEVHQKILARVLNTYREENSRIRNSPAPAHFAYFPALICPDASAIVMAITNEHDRFREEIDQIPAMAEAARQRILSSADIKFNAMLEKINAVHTTAQVQFQNENEQGA